MEKNKKTLIFAAIVIGLCAIAGIKIFESEGNSRYEISQNEDIEKENGSSSSESAVNQNANTQSSTVTVYISGAVKTEGVVTMSSEDRLSDAIKVMGGIVDGADMNAINLAEKLIDGKHYVIPKEGEQIPLDVNAGGATSTTQQGGNPQSGGQRGNLININTATVEQLDTLPGVGEATANKIINYREQNGGFKNIEDLKNVKGIGDKKFEDMKGSICV